MIGTGRAAIFDREEQDSDVEDRPERLKRDKDPVIDEERMSEEEDRCGEPDEIRVNAEPGRAPLSKQMDNLRHIANKAERDASKPQELRGVQMHDEAARPRPHHRELAWAAGVFLSAGGALLPAARLDRLRRPRARESRRSALSQIKPLRDHFGDWPALDINFRAIEAYITKRREEKN